MTAPGSNIVLRIDDVGASSKRYEVYSEWRWQRGPLRLDSIIEEIVRTELGRARARPQAFKASP